MDNNEKLKMCLQPCVKFSCRPLKDQMAKLEEEVSEVKRALKDFKALNDFQSREALAVEIVDVIISSISFLYMLGYLSLEQRLRVYHLTFLKNLKRGYYKRDDLRGFKRNE